MMNKQYYLTMFKRKRLMYFRIKEELAGCITFYITDDEMKYVKADPWGVFEDNPEGTICYIAQFISNKNKINAKFSYEAWHTFKDFIKTNFPQVRSIRWRRWNWKSEVVKSYQKEM